MATVSGVWSLNNTLYLNNLIDFVVAQSFEEQVNFTAAGVSNTEFIITGNIETNIITALYYDESGYVYNSGAAQKWNTNNNSILDFGSTPQTVTDEFYDWLTSNGIQGGITISGAWTFNEVLSFDNIPYGFIRNYILYSNTSGHSFSKLTVYGDGTDSLRGVRTSGGSEIKFYNAGAWVNEIYKTLDFGTEPQYITQEFYNWLSANASGTAVLPGYNINYSLINCYGVSNPTTISSGESLQLQFKANAGYFLPEDISVTGADLLSWNSSNGNLTIGNAISNVTISINAVQLSTYDGVDNNVSIPIQSSTVFNTHIKLNASGIGQLAQTIISPPVLPSLFQKPNDWISALTFYPFDVVALETESKKLRLGGIDTEVDCWSVNTGFVYFNMGEYFYAPYFNNFADYNGYTQIRVQLPYYGEIELHPNDVLNKYIQFRLKVDYNSGQGVWYIGVSDTSIPYTIIDNKPFADDSGYGIRIISQNVFKIGIEIPIGTTNTAEIYRNIAMGVVRGVAIATGAYVVSAMGAGRAVTTTNITRNSTATLPRYGRTGRSITPATYSYADTESRHSVHDATPYIKGRAINSCFDVAADSLNSMHLDAGIDRPNNSIMLNNLSKSIIITRYTPKFVNVGAYYGHLYGYPVGSTYLLSNVHGYTEVASIHFEGADFNNATSKEMAMIEQAFADGVILP